MDAKALSLPSIKFSTIKSPKHLHDLIPLVTRSDATRNNKNIPSFNCMTEYFMNSFLPNVRNKWNKLDIKITNLTSHDNFKNSSLSFIRPLHFDTFGIHNPVAL